MATLPDRIVLALVRLYPRSWRMRYEPEFRALVADMPNVGWRQVFDVIFAAGAEWIGLGVRNLLHICGFSCEEQFTQSLTSVLTRVTGLYVMALLGCQLGTSLTVGLARLTWDPRALALAAVLMAQTAVSAALLFAVMKPSLRGRAMPKSVSQLPGLLVGVVTIAIPYLLVGRLSLLTWPPALAMGPGVITFVVYGVQLVNPWSFMRDSTRARRRFVVPGPPAWHDVDFKTLKADER